MNFQRNRAINRRDIRLELTPLIDVVFLLLLFFLLLFYKVCFGPFLLPQLVLLVFVSFPWFLKVVNGSDWFCFGFCRVSIGNDWLTVGS